MIPSRLFTQNRWSGLRQAQLPSIIVADGGMRLPADALSIYAVLLYLHQTKMKAIPPERRTRELFAKVKVSQERLMHYTGFSINKITSGTRLLEAYGLIDITHHRRKAYPIDQDTGKDNGPGRTSVEVGTDLPVPLTPSSTSPPAPPSRRRRRRKNPENMTARATCTGSLNPALWCPLWPVLRSTGNPSW